MSYKDAEFSDLKGQVLVSIENKNDELIFTTNTGKKYKMFHYQDCCESVTIEDICGDLNDLISTDLDHPILTAEERTSDTALDGTPPPEYRDVEEMWTFYELATIKGSVTIRWFGSSNGYYSVGVSFEEIKNEAA
jgi:hypothetical protein